MLLLFCFYNFGLQLKVEGKSQDCSLGLYAHSVGSFTGETKHIMHPITSNYLSV